MAFRSFQTRVVVSFLILITLVQIGSVIVVYSAIERSARVHVKEELATTAKVVSGLIAARNRRLVEAARILSADFAFKQVVALDDSATLLSALDNHRTRLGADLMLVASLDGTRVIDTLHRDGRTGSPGALSGLPPLIEAARGSGQAADFMVVDEHPYQVVVVPLLAPAPIAWICMGFLIDGHLARELELTTSSRVSFVRAAGDHRWASAASTLPPAAEQALLNALPRVVGVGDGQSSVEFLSGDFETLVMPLPSSIGAGIDVALQRSLTDAMEPYRFLRTALLALFVGAAGVSIVGGTWIARGVSRPVRQLVSAARKIEAGTYTGSVATTHRDEIGELTATFNRMTNAVAEREESLRESEQRFRAMTESAVDGVVTVDGKGHIVSWNRGARAIFGYAAAEVVGTSLQRLIPECDRDIGHGGLARSTSPDAGGATPSPVERYGLRRNGQEFPIELSLAWWETREGAFVTAIIRDVTERKQLEAQFLQAQKMESVGRLAGGVAHDFNNLLTVIGGQAELARLRAAPDDPVRERIGLILEASARAADLTQQLLAFSRKQVLEPKILDLNAVVAQVAPMLRRLIGEDIELVTRPAPHLGHVEADPGQLTQIIVNLVVNARDVMPKGGRLTIETDDVDLDETFTHRHAEARPGPHVMLAVSDTGVGMDDETRSHIFEPFFTTKEPGKGTGLGLATVYGIVKQSNGSIDVYSELGHGTTFKIYLPRVEKPAETVTEEEPALADGGSETILLVEDDERVRALACEVLEAHGYTVLEARHGPDAVDSVRRYHGAIHLLVTDVVMPGMSGRELAGRLRPERPQMKILYMSGYTADAISHHGVLAEGEAFVSKPLMPKTLLAKVREILDA